MKLQQRLFILFLIFIGFGYTTVFASSDQKGIRAPTRILFTPSGPSIRLPYPVCKLDVLSGASVHLRDPYQLLVDQPDMNQTIGAYLLIDTPISKRKSLKEYCSKAVFTRIVLSGRAAAIPTLPIASLVHMESGSLTLTHLDGSEKDAGNQRVTVALMDGKRVLMSETCEARNCLLELGTSTARMLLRSTGKPLNTGQKIKRNRRGDTAILNGPLSIRLFSSDFTFMSGDELEGIDVLKVDESREIDRLRFTFTNALTNTYQLEATEEPIAVSLNYPEAISRVQCDDATCVLEGDKIKIFAIDRTTDTLRLTMKLKKGMRTLFKGRLRQKYEQKLPVQRCRIKVPTIPLLAGVERHRFPVAIARGCFKGSFRTLRTEAWPPTNIYIRSELPLNDSTWRYFELVFPKVPEKEKLLELSFFDLGQQGTLMGKVSIEIADNYRPREIRIQLDELGLIDLLPTNRKAQLSMAFLDPVWSDQIKPDSLLGFYHITTAPQELGFYIEAAKEARGQVPLKLKYLPHYAAPFDQLNRADYPLARFESHSRFTLRTINIPIPLTSSALHKSVIEMICTLPNGVERTLSPNRVELIPFESRNSCRLTLHKDRIPFNAGEQRVIIAASKMKRLLIVQKGQGTISLALSPENLREFDRMEVTVSHDYSSGDYDFSPEQDIGAESRYQLVLGDRSFSVSVSTSMPTGLFRFGADQQRDSLALSAGGLLRFVWLYKEGRPFPLGADIGLLGTGINDEPHLSLVGGLSLSVPVLNANTVLETSFNLHAWFEYSPTRSSTGVSPWALLFGPSFAVGKFSTNL